MASKSTSHPHLKTQSSHQSRALDTGCGNLTQTSKDDKLHTICGRNNNSLSCNHMDSHLKPLHIFPNPASDRIYICSDNACEAVDYEISSIHGVILQSGNATDHIDKFTLNSGGLQIVS